MSIVFVLVCLGLMLLAVAVGAFVWAVRHGQFDDLDGPGWQMLLEQDESSDNG